MSARALTPTLIICAAVAVGGGIALARPASTPVPVASAADPTTTATAASSGGYGRKAPAANAPKATRKGQAQGQAPAGGAAKGAALTISGFAFGSPLTVGSGATVAVRNRDSAPHTVSGDGFDTGTVAGGGSGSFTAPSAPGTYRFTCQIHPSMTGSLTVR